ncbi:hypothetical protein W911_16700 [Hyphomicrobium nitrativorans NL23]|uniref:Uncharacterized protein n=1 Tax=Hyphomicrobium nitrativorans NL23 TaxID=1029756 RepID=V5SIQ8_9HYPH|nr:hypothetical protein W911_16700 [Hyphomicrobium nitrativorans NL23]
MVIEGVFGLQANALSGDDRHETFAKSGKARPLRAVLRFH